MSRQTQQTPDEWRARQIEYAGYDAEYSPEQRLSALRSEFPGAPPGVLEKVAREFDPRNGYSLSTLAREALGLPDPTRPPGAEVELPPAIAVLPPDQAGPPQLPNKNRGIAGSAAERWADSVIRNARGHMNLGLDPVVLSAYTIKGAALIESGLRTFAEWSQQMVSQFGDHIRPHLQELWERARGQVREVSVESGGISQWPEDRSTDPLPASPITKLKGARSQWIKPDGWQGPAKGRGNWLGAEGDSVFRLNDGTADEYGVPRGTEIPFRGGVPDFSTFAVPLPNGQPGVFQVPGIIGKPSVDLIMIRDRIAAMTGMSKSEVVKWQRANDVRLHHFNGDTVQTPSHGYHRIHHTGGAAALRKQTEK